MRRVGVFASIAAFFVVMFTAVPVSLAQISPFYSHGVGTDFCVQCHDVHESRGDYMLTREATVTATCLTCHGLFGAPAPSGVVWSETPVDFAGTEPTASTMLVYEYNMTGMNASQMDAVPGHSLGTMRGDAIVRESNMIPGGGTTLKVMSSGQYGGFSLGLYSGEAVTTFNGTKGLYCASCHTAHDTIGQMMSGPGLLSSKPNHTATAAVDSVDYCVKCHDRRDNVGLERNHPSTYCLVCHGNKAGESDFPHTSSNQKLLAQEPDALCILCHPSGSLP